MVGEARGTGGTAAVRVVRSRQGRLDTLKNGGWATHARPALGQFLDCAEVGSVGFGGSGCNQHQWCGAARADEVCGEWGPGRPTPTMLEGGQQVLLHIAWQGPAACWGRFSKPVVQLPAGRVGRRHAPLIAANSNKARRWWCGCVCLCRPLAGPDGRDYGQNVRLRCAVCACVTPSCVRACRHTCGGCAPAGRDARAQQCSTFPAEPADRPAALHQAGRARAAAAAGPIPSHTFVPAFLNHAPPQKKTTRPHPPGT